MRGHPDCHGWPMALQDQTPLSAQDVYLLREGTHTRLADTMGGRLLPDGAGARFSVWAPNASRVSVIGDWNGWSVDADPLRRRDDGSGVWDGTVAAANDGALYKYRVVAANGHATDKADPLALAAEAPPSTASRLVGPIEHRWQDDEWMRERVRRQAPDAPMSIYEVHLGSWRRNADGDFLA